MPLKKFVCAALLSTFLLTSCSISSKKIAASPSNSSKTYGFSNDSGDRIDQEDDDETEDPTSPPVRVDPDSTLMESMECHFLESNFLEANKSDFGIPSQAVKVEVGEGLNAGENWWIVVYDSPSDTSYSWGIRQFLTTAPSDSSFQGKWIPLEDPFRWTAVAWPEEKLVVAQSALTKALACLDE